MRCIARNYPESRTLYSHAGAKSYLSMAAFGTVIPAVPVGYPSQEGATGRQRLKAMYVAISVSNDSFAGRDGR